MTGATVVQVITPQAVYATALRSPPRQAGDTARAALYLVDNPGAFKLVYLLVTRGPMLQKELQMWTYYGFPRYVKRAHLKWLVEQGLVEVHRRKGATLFAPGPMAIEILVAAVQLLLRIWTMKLAELAREKPRPTKEELYERVFAPYLPRCDEDIEAATRALNLSKRRALRATDETATGYKEVEIFYKKQ